MSQFRIVRRFADDQKGNIAILFAASAIPLLLVMGGAVDLTRYNRYRAELSNAVDAAALSLARNVDKYDDECPQPDEDDDPVPCDDATADTEEFIEALDVADDTFAYSGVSASRILGGFEVSAVGEMETVFLPIGAPSDIGRGVTTMSMEIMAQVRQSSNRVELALVFDNTGSMTETAGPNDCNSSRDRMAGLRCAATLLVDELMPMNTSRDPDMMKIAVVPFEGAVNVASTGFSTASPPTWVEWNNVASAHYAGRNFRTNQLNVGGSSAMDRIGPRWMYSKLGISWAGCVEMRAEPYDVLDTVPTSGTPNTLFVPMFWPDEPDTSTQYWNNYLTDGFSGTPAARQLDLTKYNKSSPSLIAWTSPSSTYKDTTFPYEYGPNRGCPRPITPLTNSEATVDAAIGAMTPHGATGTFIPTGLVWGWHVLSPTIPYTEGIGPGDEEFEDTVKAIVLLSDGANSSTIAGTNSSNHNKSTYSGFNYPALAATNVVSGQNYYRRLRAVNTNSTPTDAQANAILNSKTLTLCTNVKSAGIRLYTITFGDMSQTAQDLMDDCASVDDDGKSLYYHAPSSAELENIFNEIGQDLTEIHLSR